MIFCGNPWKYGEVENVKKKTMKWRDEY